MHDELLRAVSSLNCQISAGGTLVPQHIVHGISVLKPFTCIFRLFNRLFLCGEFPSSWPISVLIPAFRKGQQHDPNNYRRIALVDVLSKIYISIITKRLTLRLLICYLKTKLVLELATVPSKMRLRCILLLISI